MLPGHTMEVTASCLLFFLIRSLRKDVSSLSIWGGAVRRKGSRESSTCESNACGKTTGISFQDPWTVSGAGKCQASQVDAHEAHVSSFELSKACFCGALAPVLLCGRTTLGNPTDGMLGHRRSGGSPGKTAVDFLEQRRGPSL